MGTRRPRSRTASTASDAIDDLGISTLRISRRGATCARTACLCRIGPPMVAAASAGDCNALSHGTLVKIYDDTAVGACTDAGTNGILDGGGTTVSTCECDGAGAWKACGHGRRGEHGGVGRRRHPDLQRHQRQRGRRQRHDDRGWRPHAGAVHGSAERDPVPRGCGSRVELRRHASRLDRHQSDRRCETHPDEGFAERWLPRPVRVAPSSEPSPTVARSTRPRGSAIWPTTQPTG